MKKRFIIFSIGTLLEIIAFVLLIPAGIAFFEIRNPRAVQLFSDPQLSGFLFAIVSSLICGIILRCFGSKEITGTGVKEGFAIVTFGWVILSFFGAIPLLNYILSQDSHITISRFISAFTDAYFETMSGFTTTGATIISNIEALPQGILFWRSLTHWLGGMGIITLALAILPVFGVASYQMFRGEVPGPTAERLSPKLTHTAKILWGAYAVLTLAQTILLKLGGMSVFDALCHSFGTMATGGFSTKNASLAAYNSPYIQWVIIIFMFFAGMNFIIHYQILFTGKFTLLKKDREFKFYTIVIVTVIILSTLFLQIRGLAAKNEISRRFRHQTLSEVQIDDKILQESSKISSFGQTLRHAAFQTISITTTTGYTTADFDTWPNAIRFTLVILMFFGGCAGSTGGGIKMSRILIFIKCALREIKTIIHPRIILPLKVANKTIEEKQVSNIIGFIALFMGSFLFFTIIMSFMIEDFSTAVTAVAATMCNIGPGLAGVGAAENYAWIPVGGKWILSLCMLLGRLEIYTVFILLMPSSWRK